MSKTLQRIMHHWTDGLPEQTAEWPSYIPMPFDVEAFCRENDAERDALRAALEEIATHRCLSVCDEIRPNHFTTEAEEIARKALGGK